MRNAFWTTAARLLRYKRLLALGLSGALVSAICFGAGLSLMLPVFSLFFNRDAVAAGMHPLRQLVQDNLAAAGDPAWQHQLADTLNPWIPQDLFICFVVVMAVIATLSILGSVGRYVHELLTITVVQRAAQDQRERLFRSLVQAPMGCLGLKEAMREGMNEGSGFASRVVVDVNVVARGHLAIVSKAVAEILKGAAAFAAAMMLDWRLTALAVVVVVPIAILLKQFGRTIRRASRRALQEQSRMLKTLHEVFTALAVVKTSSAEGYERRRFRRLNRRLFQEQMNMRQARALASPTVETLALVGVIAAASVAAWLIFRRGYDPAQFLTVLLLLAAGGASLKPLTAVHTQIKEAQSAAERLLEAESLPSEPILPQTRRAHPSLPRHHRRVAFEQVDYTYPGTQRAALQAVDLDVPFGSTTAIVGPNGAGKSTLLALLPRLIEPSHGRVLIDDADIAQVNLRALRDQIAVVTQQTVLFEGTIADNIAYGRRHIARDRIAAAAKAAFAHDFITAHPDGYDRMLGEGGEGLSGGQKQRLAIARAILRDPAILILDEATSQIDAESETKINRALDELRHGRTTFIIAHRLSTVVDADQIVVMVDGRIADQGRHEELLARCPTYQVLTRTQLRAAPPPTPTFHEVTP